MDDLDKPVISIPQPTWYYILACLVYGSLSALFGAVVVVLLTQDHAMVGTENKGRPPVSASNRWPYIIVNSVLCPLPLVGLYFVMGRPRFKVGPNGMILEKIRVRWDQVVYCHWGHHEPDVLNVKIQRALHFVRVPQSQRADVEKAIRAYGKWQTE
jgi:hypothetical protein